MPKFSPLLIALALMCAGHARAGAYDNYYERIQGASWQADTAALGALSGELNGLASAALGSGDGEAGMAAAYADYRLANAGMAAPQLNGALIDAALARARQRLETLAAQASPAKAEAKAEALAMLSGVYGLEIARSPAKGMTLGIKAGGAIEAARKLAPDNARVQLFAGIGKLYTPALFGGDRSQSIADFDAVIARLAGQASALNWGLDDAYVWRGIALASDGRPDEARASYAQALSVAPRQRWAQTLLAKPR